MTKEENPLVAFLGAVHELGIARKKCIEAGYSEHSLDLMQRTEMNRSPNTKGVRAGVAGAPAGRAS